MKRPNELCDRNKAEMQELFNVFCWSFWKCSIFNVETTENSIKIRFFRGIRVERWKKSREMRKIAFFEILLKRNAHFSRKQQEFRRNKSYNNNINRHNNNKYSKNSSRRESQQQLRLGKLILSFTLMAKYKRHIRHAFGMVAQIAYSPNWLAQKSLQAGEIQWFSAILCCTRIVCHAMLVANISV